MKRPTRIKMVSSKHCNLVRYKFVLILFRYHKTHGHQTQQLHENGDGTFSIVNPETSIPYSGNEGMEREKPYKCDYCGKRYKNLNGLKYVSIVNSSESENVSSNEISAQTTFYSLRPRAQIKQPLGCCWVGRSRSPHGRLARYW